ncbi:hypothetical protein AZI86_17335 [Bdellovibrio bacteriovorus]|uniref:DUF883 domain-containing protein n=1 Tax=Bdellovibrio bacteriovorus TaxID=959 RepID=A0A150WEP1_BDEBC|nr:hypothetical protein [Bdellovibrio bacteriovorus]KYG61476.1 hypothetical protein AZI86_17335 [Bdellovibrio bacteriovorus]
MDRDQLVAEIKKLLQEELKNYTRPLTEKISDVHKEQALEFKNDATIFVKENPWIAVGAAAGLGFLIARLIYKGED